MVKNNLVFALIIIVLVTTIFLYFRNSSKGNNSIKDDSCTNQIELEDLNKDKQKEFVIPCKNSIKFFISNKKNNSNFVEVEDRNSFPDFFYFTAYGSKTKEKVTNNAYLFPKNNPQFIVISSMYDGGPWQRYAYGIYKINKNEISRVFKKGFFDIEGRWPFIKFDETKPTLALNGDHGYIGTLGNRLDWIDFYSWSAKEQKFMLDNTNHKEEYQKLLDSYEQIDNSGCKAALLPTTINGQEGLTFTELYKQFPNEKYYCSKDGETKENIVALIKGIATIKEIIRGENKPYLN